MSPLVMCSAEIVRVVSLIAQIEHSIKYGRILCEASAFEQLHELKARLYNLEVTWEALHEIDETYDDSETRDEEYVELQNLLFH